MSNIEKNTHDILESVIGYPNVTVVCASKYLNTQEMTTVYQNGISHFGENYVTDLLDKMDQLKDLNIIWHFIGHLQTNKVKKVINKISYLHSLDNLKLAQEIQKHRKDVLPCFIEINVSNEDSKTGIPLIYLEEFLLELQKYDKIKVVGLMTIGVLNDIQETEAVFKLLETLNQKHHLKYLSMGMTNDYEIALKYGANFIRIGRKFIS